MVSYDSFEVFHHATGLCFMEPSVAAENPEAEKKERMWKFENC